MKYLLIPLFLFFLLQACFYDKEELLYMTNNNTCDTVNVTYNATIYPILATYCLSCHGNTSAASNGNGIKLENYSDLKISVDNGKFRSAVFHVGTASQMPKNAGILNDCNLNQIDIWLKAGALNN